MNYLKLEDIKKQLNIDTEFTDDDDYLQHLGDVAESIVSRHIDYDLSELAAVDTVTSYSYIPSPVYQACLLMVGNLYANRESISFTSPSKMPFSFEYLLATYKNRTNFRS